MHWTEYTPKKKIEYLPDLDHTFFFPYAYNETENRVGVKGLAINIKKRMHQHLFSVPLFWDFFPLEKRIYFYSWYLEENPKFRDVLSVQMVLVKNGLMNPFFVSGNSIWFLAHEDWEQKKATVKDQEKEFNDLILENWEQKKYTRGEFPEEFIEYEFVQGEEKDRKSVV